MLLRSPHTGLACRRGGEFRAQQVVWHHRPSSTLTLRSSTQSAPVTEAPLSPPAAASGYDTSPVDRWYASGGVAIHRQVENVKITLLEGKGRGVLATRDLAVGEVVLATPPLAIVNSPQRQRPSGELVVDQILERKLYGSKWFSVLYDGSSRSCKAQFDLGSGEQAPADTVGADEPLRGALPPEPLVASTSSPSPASAAAGQPAGAAGKKKGFLASRAATRRGKGASSSLSSGFGSPSPAAAAGGAAGATITPDELPVPDRREQTRLAKVVKFNCFGDDTEDLAACECRGEQPRGHIGLWPEFALLNHSCAPNAVNYVVGDTMVVRACRSIKAGEEVTISYLGRPQLMPVGRRISTLSEDYGFECNCVRCTTEQAHYDKFEDVYMELWEDVDEKLGPAFLEARAAGDKEAIREVQGQVQAWLRHLYGAFRKTLLAPDVRNYVIASLYDAYDLCFNCAAALGEGEDASALQASLKAMEEVSAGSDLHVILAVRHYDWVLRQHGEASPLTGLARAALRRAHVARYGPVSPVLLDRLVTLNRKLHVEVEAPVAGAG